MAVVGPKEAETHSAALRDRLQGDLGAMPLSEMIAKLTQEVTDRSIRHVAKSELPTADESTKEVANEY